MQLYININGDVIPAGQLALPADNCSYRYGDGLFETMKITEGQIILEEYHFERLNSGMLLLQFNVPEFFRQENIRNEIIKLCQKNNCEHRARVRFSVSRGSGGLFDCDDKVQFIIECWPLKDPVDQINENGLVIDIFPDARKTCDVFSNLKSSNYLPYVMAAIWAKENKLNESLILNIHDRICDATIANVFWAKSKTIFTPPLSEGCVGGVMRRYLLEKSKAGRFNIQESVCTKENLEDADEIFLTNIISGIRWVKHFREKEYSNNITRQLVGEINLNLA